MPVVSSGCGRHCGVAVKIVGIAAIAGVLGLAVVKDVLWPSNFNSVQVVGQGRVAVTPDAALVNFGVLTIREETPEATIQKTSEAISRVESALDALGIPKENRQITGYVLNPRYQEMPVYQSGQNAESAGSFPTPKIDGYTATQQVTVLVPFQGDEKKINEVIAEVTKAGANQVGEVKMVATNGEKLKQEARMQALADAREKAKNMAKAAGVKLGSVSGWYESVLAAPGLRELSSGVYNNAPSAVASSTPYTPAGIVILQPGQLEIVMELTVSYMVRE